jgi:hypothetical protein
MSQQPIALSDEALTMLFQLAEPLSPSDRGEFLECVAQRLQGREIGDGVIARVAREVISDFRRAVGEPPRNPSRWSSKRANGVRAV